MSPGPYPKLFEPVRMAGVTLRNRIVLAGHGSRFVDPDRRALTDRQAEYLAERAKGGTGLIIQGSAMVHPTGLALPGVQEAWSEESVAANAVVADAVHEHGAAIFGQLSHLGRQGHSFTSQRELWAPSAVPDASRVVPHAMTRTEIGTLKDAYRSAAVRFLRAGFDGVEVYLAHGYLLCEFVSSFSNRRTDEYGGSLENRLRLPLEIVDAVRAEVGPDVPIGIRVSAEEFVEGGLTVPETREMVTRFVAEQQLEYVSVSQSNWASIEAMIPDMSFERAPFVKYAGAIREVTGGVPVMAVARIVTPERCEQILADGLADLVCLVRPLIADPEFANKAAEGRREEIRECISCNVGCRGGPHRGLPVMCLVNPAVGFEREWGIGRLGLADAPRRVTVVGGGPGGLKAAETAALRGHAVTLLEATDRLGGQVLTAAAAMPYRDEFANSTRFLEKQLERLGVEIRRGVEAGAGTIAELAPDAVVVATGSRPGRPDVPGRDLPHVCSVHDAIAEGVDGESVVVIDAGEADWKCLTTAERLAADGHRVRLVSPVPVGAELDQFSKPPLLRRLRRVGVTFLEYRVPAAFHERSVELRDVLADTVETLDDVDAVVLSWYGVARDELFGELEADGVEVHAVGDALAPRRAIDAIWDGFRIGRQL